MSKTASRTGGGLYSSEIASIGASLLYGAYRGIGRDYYKKNSIHNSKKNIATKHKMPALTKTSKKKKIQRKSKRDTDNCGKVCKYVKKPTVCELKRDIVKVRKDIKPLYSTKTKRWIGATQLTTNSNEQEHGYLVGNSNNILDETIQDVRMWDDVSNSYTTSSNFASQVKSVDFLFDKAYAKLTVRNNFSVPADITVYVVSPKDDTSVNPVDTIGATGVDAMEKGIEDQDISFTTDSSNKCGYYLTDSRLFNRLYKIEKSVHKVINAGQQFAVSHATNKFKFNPSNFDSHTTIYHKKHGSWLFVIQIRGVLAHDSTTTTQVGLAPAGVDLLLERTVKLRYVSGGGKLEDIQISNTLTTMSNPVVSTNGVSTEFDGNYEEAGAGVNN